MGYFIDKSVAAAAKVVKKVIWVGIYEIVVSYIFYFSCHFQCFIYLCSGFDNLTSSSNYFLLPISFCILDQNMASYHCLMYLLSASPLRWKRSSSSLHMSAKATWMSILWVLRYFCWFLIHQRSLSSGSGIWSFSCLLPYKSWVYFDLEVGNQKINFLYKNISLLCKHHNYPLAKLWLRSQNSCQCLNNLSNVIVMLNNYTYFLAWDHLIMWKWKIT